MFYVMDNTIIRKAAQTLLKENMVVKMLSTFQRKSGDTRTQEFLGTNSVCIHPTSTTGNVGAGEFMTCELADM